jgi:hypothetical protein
VTSLTGQSVPEIHFVAHYILFPTVSVFEMVETCSIEDRTSVFIPRSSLLETKFHRGFLRRRHLANFDRARDERERSDSQRKSAQNDRLVSEYSFRDIIVGSPNVRYQRERERRHVSNQTFDSDQLKEHTKRVAESNCRYFTQTMPVHRGLRIPVECDSIVIGRHRSRSLGILDNFTDKQIELSPPPKRLGSINKNKSQIEFV